MSNRHLKHGLPASTAHLSSRSLILSLNTFLEPNRFSLVTGIFHKKLSFGRKVKNYLFPFKKKNRQRPKNCLENLISQDQEEKILCNYRRSTNLWTAVDQFLPPCFRRLGLNLANPCLRGAGGLPKPMDLYGHTLRLCTETADSIKEGPPQVHKEHTHIILINRVQVLHSFLNTTFQVRIHPRGLDLLQFVYYAIYSPTASRKKGWTPGDPHPTAHTATFTSSVPPKTLAEGKMLRKETKLEGLEALVAQARVCRRCPWHNSWMRYSRAMRGWNTSWDGWKGSFNSQG